MTAYSPLIAVVLEEMKHLAEEEEEEAMMIDIDVSKVYGSDEDDDDNINRALQGGEILSSDEGAAVPVAAWSWSVRERILLEKTLRPFFNDIWYKDDMSAHTTKLMHRFNSRSMTQVAEGIEAWMNSCHFEPYLARLPDPRRAQRSLRERLERRKRIDTALMELIECCYALGVEMSMKTPLPVRRVRRECTKKRARDDDDVDKCVTKRARLEFM
jgi:hypothetical protein